MFTNNLCFGLFCIVSYDIFSPNILFILSLNCLFLRIIVKILAKILYFIFQLLNFTSKFT